MDDVFCKIVRSEIPAAKVYEDEKVLAFLDINPVNYGHVLLIPKSHFEMITDTPDDILAHAFIKVKMLMLAVKKAMTADFVVVNVTGIDIPHFHIHIIPKFFNDDLKSWPTKKYNAGEIERIAEKIKLSIDK